MSRKIFYTCILGCIGLVSFYSDSYTQLTLLLFGIVLIMLIDKLGKGIVLLETTALFFVLTCLVMPVIGYKVYTISNPIAKLWVRYMPVNKDIYFGYSLPAIAMFTFAITFPLLNSKYSDEGQNLFNLIEKIKKTLKNQKNSGIKILIIGILISLITNYLPSELSFFASLFFFASFAGLLYVHFSPKFRYKTLLFLTFLIFLINNALNTGMFTVLAFMSITLFSFFYFGNQTSIIKKLFFVILGFFLFMILQNTKRSFRLFTWKSNYTENKAILFSKLFIDNLKKGDVLIEPRSFFPIYSRANQGYNVALTMRRIPAIKPFDGGNRLASVFASTFIPRFLWPDKPEAGGQFNMEYYAGYRIRGWTTNVGPLGEAYGSFGIYGGISYMFLLGWFIRFVYKRIFIISKRIPLLICWLPVMFFQVIYSAENDTLQILNSLFKSSMFVFILYKTLPFIFFPKSQTIIIRQNAKPILVS